MTKEASLALNLSALDENQRAQDEGIDVHIKGPDGKSLGFVVRVAGPDSEIQRKAQVAYLDSRIDAEETGGGAAELERSQMFIMSRATISWSRPVAVDGVELTCSPENCEKLYTRYPIIYDQVVAKARNRAAFTKRS